MKKYIEKLLVVILEKIASKIVTEKMIKDTVMEICKLHITDVRAIAKEIIQADVKFLCDTTSIKQSIASQIKWAIISYIQNNVTCDKVEEWKKLPVSDAILERKKNLD